MRSKKNAFLLLWSVLMATLLSCDISFKGEEPDLDRVVQLTMQALQQTQTAAAAGLQPTLTQESPIAPTATENGGGQVQVTPTITSTPIPCNKPKFQSETIPDGTEFDKGETFVKTWRIKNEGTCTWNTSYKLVFVSGDKMGGPTSKNLTQEIRPGETADISVNLTAPSTNGEYKGYWKLESDEGEQFGNYWVQIRVGPPAGGPFAVTSVAFSVAPVTNMGCPGEVSISAEIFVSGAGTVTYQWDDSEGGTKSGSITFDEAGSKTVNYKVYITSTYDEYWARIYIDSPNHQWFGPKYFAVNCT